MDLDQFFGRQIKLELLTKRVLDLKEGYRQNIAFLGSRFIGKTSILQKFLADIDDREMVQVYLDLERKDFRYFTHKYVGGLLAGYARLKGIPVSDDIGTLIESLQPHIPCTVKAARKIQELLAPGKMSEAYREIIALPELLTHEGNVYCVIVLDEFHNIDDLDVPEAFLELGKKIMTQRRCLYIVASSHPLTARKILSEKLSLLFGNFEIVQVDAFDVRTAQGFIGFHLGEIPMKTGLRNFLIDFTGGHPLYLQLICEELISLRAVHKQNEIFVPLLTRAIENVLFNPWGVLGRHFELVMDYLSSLKNHQLIPDILMTLASGKHRLSELAQGIGVKQNAVSLKINYLLEIGIVIKNGNFFYIKDKLLRYWIRHVYQGRLRSLQSDAEVERSVFRADLQAAVDQFFKSNGEDLSTRIVDLLYCFENESLNINGRRYKLPVFEEAVPVKLRTASGGALDVIKASCREGEWFIVLKKDGIAESDLNAIINESKTLPQKPQGCILISLSDLDESTRVKALQERMWIWNEGELNTLLNLYNKSFILQPEVA